jgi:hypothetical protein
MSYFAIKSHKSGRCLDIPGGRTNNGTEIQQWDCDINNKNQQWVMSEGRIKHRHSNKCLDSNQRDNGKRFYIWDCASNNINQNQKMLKSDLSKNVENFPKNSKMKLIKFLIKFEKQLSTPLEKLDLKLVINLMVLPDLSKKKLHKNLLNSPLLSQKLSILLLTFLNPSLYSSHQLAVFSLSLHSYP